MTGKKAHALGRPQTQAQTDQQADEAEAPGGPTHRRGGRTKDRRKPADVATGQRQKHMQGSARRGIAPAPSPPTTVQGIIPAATAKGFTKHRQQ
jgi:hypothetical protein